MGFYYIGPSQGFFLLGWEILRLWQYLTQVLPDGIFGLP